MTGTERHGRINQLKRDLKIIAYKVEDMIKELEELEKDAGEQEYQESELYQKRSAQ